MSTAIRAAVTALPQGPSLGSGLCCPGPSSLIRPHPPHSRAHRDFAAERLIRHAFAVPLPRRPASGSVLSPLIPCRHAALYDPGEFAGCSRPALDRRCCLHQQPNCSALPTTHNPLHVVEQFRGYFGSLLLRPVDLLASLADPTGSLLPADGDVYTQASDASVSLRVAGYDYDGAGQLPSAGLSPAGTAASIAALAVLLEASRGATSSGTTPVVLADAGFENVNAQVDALITTGLLRRFLAFTELRFSNSMIEAWWRSLKHH